MKPCAPKDYQVLLDDPKFRGLLCGYHIKWQAYRDGGIVWLCAEIHGQIDIDKLLPIEDYCSRRFLRATISVHPEKNDYLFLMIQKQCAGRLTAKKITPPKIKEGTAKRVYSALQKAIDRNGGNLIGGAVAYEAKRLSNALN